MSEAGVPSRRTPMSAARFPLLFLLAGAASEAT